MAKQFVQYAYLQLLDLLTTIAFLLHGITEGNPMVRLAMNAAPNPVWGLLAVKLIALLLGLYCWKRAKFQLLGRVNVLFAILVAWNLVALILGSVFPHHLS
jgi:hypothetical protein